MLGDDILEIDGATFQSLRHAVAALGTGGPLPVVVASAPYAALLDNWLAHFHRLGLSRVLVVAMDPELAALLSDRGLVVARGTFNGTATDFWLRRMLIWRALIAMGIDIIQSDIDALWFKDPTEPFFLGQPFDFVCSQGTLHPQSAVDRWGFVLCTGFMAIRGSKPSLRFLNAVCQRATEILSSDDQVVMNDLLGEVGTVWETEGLVSQRVAFDDGASYTTFSAILPGRCERFGLNLGLLPHALFPRLPVPGNDAYVKHLLRPEHDAERIDQLKAAACWLMDDQASG